MENLIIDDVENRLHNLKRDILVILFNGTVADKIIWKSEYTDIKYSVKFSGIHFGISKTFDRSAPSFPVIITLTAYSGELNNRIVFYLNIEYSKDNKTYAVLNELVNHLEYKNKLLDVQRELKQFKAMNPSGIKQWITDLEEGVERAPAMEWK